MPAVDVNVPAFSTVALLPTLIALEVEVEPVEEIVPVFITVGVVAPATPSPIWTPATEVVLLIVPALFSVLPAMLTINGAVTEAPEATVTVAGVVPV